MMCHWKSYKNSKRFVLIKGKTESQMKSSKPMKMGSWKHPFPFFTYLFSLLGAPHHPYWGIPHRQPMSARWPWSISEKWWEDCSPITCSQTVNSSRFLDSVPNVFFCIVASAVQWADVVVILVVSRLREEAKCTPSLPNFEFQSRADGQWPMGMSTAMLCMSRVHSACPWLAWPCAGTRNRRAGSRPPHTGDYGDWGSLERERGNTRSCRGIEMIIDSEGKSQRRMKGMWRPEKKYKLRLDQSRGSIQGVVCL